MADRAAELLIDLKEDETFLRDKRDVEAALIHARPFATQEPIKSREEAGEVADVISDLSRIVKRVGENRLATTKVWRDSTSHVNSHCNELVSQPETAIAVLKEKALAFKQAEERQIAKEQREAQERLDREAEEKAAEAQAAAELAAEEPSNPEARQLHAEAHEEAARAAVATAPTPSPPKQVRGSIGKVGSRTEYRPTVMDAAELPAQFTMPNERAIKAAIQGERAMAKAQNRPFNLNLIPGVQIVEDEIPVRGSA